MLNICSISSVAWVVDQVEFNVSATKTKKLIYVLEYYIIGFCFHY